MIIKRENMTKEEAINEIKSWDFLEGKEIEAIYTLIPELKPSADERIRKCIEMALTDVKEQRFLDYGTSLKDCLYWLEKQKERGPLTKEEEYNLHRIIEFLEDETCPSEWISLLHDIYCLPYEKQKEKPIKMEVYEVGKGTTICGQDYKCKKDYKTSTCKYIKDAIYHCSRDGYLNDQNGVSWSCPPEWFNEYIYTNSELADKEKNDFVSGQFLQCKLSFDEFKEGEHYWLEYVGDDMYVGRSDNVLNQKFHITPRQLYTLFSQQLEENKKEPEDKGEISDGYHTFNELYYYRMLYNAAFFNLLPKEWVHKSKRHHDGEECFGGGWFVVMANLPTGQISNHYELKDWDLFQIPEKEIADEWDRHTPQEAAERIHKYLLEKQKENPKSTDSIPSDVKCENRWHKVEDSLPDNTREVLCKDAIGNYFIGRYYSKGIWEISIYDDCDKSNEDNPPVVMWIDIPSEKQKEPHYTKRNALFDKCVENCDPKVMKKVSDEIDEMLQKEQKPIVMHTPRYAPPEQKPAEWSEEEKLHYTNVLEALEYVKGCKSDYDKIEAVKSDIAWFKSLRPQPHWKPSEGPVWRIWKNGACGNSDGIPIALVKRGSTYRLVSCLGPVGEKYIMLSDLKKLPGFDEGESQTERQEPHWKPTKEQMKALLKVVDKARELHYSSNSGYNEYDVLRSLYKQLKEL